MYKKKRTVFQSIKKDLFKGLRRLYYFSYTKFKYFFYTLRSLLLRNKINRYKISILLPTRERSKKFERMLLSLNKTCKYKDRIEILILLDEDDKEISNYLEIINNKFFNSLKFNLFKINLSTHAIRNNYLAKKCSGEIIFPINDDMIFVSNNWDIEIDQEFSKLNMKNPFCLWIKSNIKYQYLHCDYPIINRSWYEKLKYVGSENFNFWYLDTWICDLSMRSGLYLVTPNIIVDQLSANRIKTEVDNTHLRNINSSKGEKDLEIWHKTKKERILHSKYLKKKL